MKGIHYLASPYTASTKREMHANYLEAVDATAWLLARRIWVYSPIVHCHELALLHDLPKDFNFWLDYNHAIIDGLGGIIVLHCKGTDASKGVRDETDYARAIGKPISLLIKRKGAYELVIDVAVREVV